MKKRIVVAEDDASMRELVVTTLRDAGYDVTSVPDGGRLLVLLTRCSRAEEPMPDAIVSDIRMPVMTGLAMLKGIRDAHWRVPTILMSAFVDDSTRRHAESLGASVLAKPFALEDLRQAIHSALG